MEPNKSSLDSLISELKKEGLGGIKNLVERKQVEQFFVDFKTTQWNDYTGKNNIAQNDLDNFRKAISGFGNSEGGILILGIDTKGKGDFANSLKPIKSPEIFLSLLNNQVSRLTIPAHSGVEFFIISDSVADFGYIVVVIPKYQGLPIQTIKEEKFYMRSGDSFMGIPHSILAGMFGRRPNPDVATMYSVSVGDPKIIDNSIQCTVGIQLVNGGKGIARDIFLNCLIFPPGDSSEISYEFNDPNFDAYKVFGVGVNLISKDGFRLAPGQRVQPLVLNFLLKPPFKDFSFNLTVGAEGQSPYEHESTLSCSELTEMYNNCLLSKNKKFSAELLKMNFTKE